MLKYLLVILMIHNYSACADDIKTIYSIMELNVKVNANSLVIIDMDDTIITPQDNFFRFDSGINKYHSFIVDLMESKTYQGNKFSDSEFNDLISNFCLKRKTMLVEAGWPYFINRLLSSNASVIILTSVINLGKFGVIDNMINWRLNELNSFNINLSKQINGLNNIEFNDGFKEGYFKDGILFTGKFSKGEILTLFLTKTKLSPDKIIVIDDKIANLRDIDQFMAEYKLSLESYLYRGVEKISGQPIELITQTQIYNLINGHRWLSDAEAFLQIVAQVYAKPLCPVCIENNTISVPIFK